MTIDKHNNINARQIKAARALLDWSQEDLANAAGLSIATIRKIEAGSISPRDKTMGSIISALEGKNIEFLSPDGLRLKDNEVTIIEGEDSYVRLMDDVYHTVKKGSGDVLFLYLDDSLSPESIIDSELRVRKTGAKFRILAEEGDTYLYYPLEEYRWIPKKYFKKNLYIIYGDKVALCIFDGHMRTNPKRIVVIENAVLMESMKSMFDFMWENCRKPTITTAPQVYE